MILFGSYLCGGDCVSLDFDHQFIAVDKKPISINCRSVRQQNMASPTTVRRHQAKKFCFLRNLSYLFRNTRSFRIGNGDGRFAKRI